MDMMGIVTRRAALASLVTLAACGTKGPESAGPTSQDGSMGSMRAGSDSPDAEDPGGGDGDGGATPAPSSTGSPTVGPDGATLSPGATDASTGLAQDAAAPPPGWKRGLAYG